MLARISLFEISDPARKFWNTVIERVVLNLSDQQLLTGLAILITGFAMTCSISTYHFALVGDLAWMSSNVHLTTLSVLQQYLYRHRTLRNWRIILMLITGSLLLANNVLSGHREWYDSWSFDAICLFNDLPGHFGGSPWYWSKVSIGLIVYNYSVTIPMLFERTWDFIEKFMYQGPAKLLQSSHETFKTRRNQSKTRLGYSKYIFLTIMTSMAGIVHKTISALLGSACVSLALDIMWFAFGVENIVIDRDIGTGIMDGNENAITFGQMIPLLLLSATIFVFREAYDGKSVLRSQWMNRSDQLHS